MHGEIAKSEKSRKKREKREKTPEKRNVREFSRKRAGIFPKRAGIFGTGRKIGFLGFFRFLAENVKSDEKLEKFDKSGEIFGLRGFWAK